MIEPATILLRAVKKGGGGVALQAVNLLANKSFELKIFKRYIKCFAECNDVTIKNAGKQMKNDAFRRVLVTG